MHEHREKYYKYSETINEHLNNIYFSHIKQRAGVFMDKDYLQINKKKIDRLTGKWAKMLCIHSARKRHANGP